MVFTSYTDFSGKEIKTFPPTGMAVTAVKLAFQVAI